MRRFAGTVATSSPTSSREERAVQVSSHIAVQDAQRDVNWLRAALQTAIALEQSTLPLYLSAMWSLRVQSYTAYNLIRTVVMEEMVHMAIACNLLAAIGGRPD